MLLISEFLDLIKRQENYFSCDISALDCL